MDFAFVFIAEHAQRVSALIGSLRDLSKFQPSRPGDRADLLPIVNGALDLRRHAISESLRYLQEAMQSGHGDAGLWFLKGRLLHATRDPAAEEAFNLAVSHGLEESRVLAYLAEIAFWKRNFSGVHALLERIRARQGSPRLQPVMRFWTGREAA